MQITIPNATTAKEVLEAVMEMSKWQALDKVV